MLNQVLNYFEGNQEEFLGYLLDHLRLSGMALVLALALGLPLGYYCYKKDLVYKLSSFTTQVLRIVPSLALLFILIPFIGVGFFPALMALFVLGLSPIVLNTAQGFKEVSPKILETAKGLGMDKGQVFVARKPPVRLGVPFSFSVKKQK